MGEYYEKVRERFIRYAKIHTESIANVTDTPTSLRQFDLARVLYEELRELGVSDVWLDEVNCVVYGCVPSNLPDGGGEAVAFIGHMDTSPDITGENVRPWVLEGYDGGDITLNQDLGIVMKAEDYPNLKQYIGQDLILTDGTTLLGGDDKAAVAAIVTLADFLLTHPEIKHGPVMLAFTPDEEVGRLAENLDIERLGAKVAYTVDGPSLGVYSYETFNAAEAQLTIHGRNVHPGTAKNIMKNAIEIGGEFMEMLPRFERPQYTEGREGYYHPFVFEGLVEKTYIRCLIRDHDDEHFAQRKAYVEYCVEMLNKQYGEGTVELKYANEYWSMRKVVSEVSYMVDYMIEAIRQAGLEPVNEPMRGGTDGSALSQRGLPCPNISAGYENAHSRYEYVPIQSMEKNVEILVRLTEIFGSHV